MVYNVALDIDQVLAFHKVKDTAHGKFFLNKGAILTAHKTHYIYPGAIEFVRLLCLTPDVRLTFFSAGIKERNEVFVSLILGLALPEPEFQHLKVSVRVLSRDDLSYNILNDFIYQHYNGGEPLSKSQKDLTKILHPGDRLENAVLIDDQSNNIAFRQVANFLKVPVQEPEDYENLIDKKEFYSEATGRRFLKCVLNIAGLEDLENGMVEEGRRIFIYKHTGGYGIRFVDIAGKVRLENICPDTFPFICEKLDTLYEKGLKERKQLVSIDNPNRVAQICHYVAQFQGRTTKLCRQANRICYAAGVLFSLLYRARTEDVALSKVLLESQFKLNANKFYEPNFHKLQKDDLYYLYGLAKLQEVNPVYELITPHTYHKYTQVAISELEDQYLQAAKLNEY